MYSPNPSDKATLDDKKCLSEWRGKIITLSHLSEKPGIRSLPDLAPTQYSVSGCRGLSGPVPPPLLMSRTKLYSMILSYSGVAIPQVEPA